MSRSDTCNNARVWLDLLFGAIGTPMALFRTCYAQLVLALNEQLWGSRFGAREEDLSVLFGVGGAILALIVLGILIFGLCPAIQSPA